MKVNSPVIFQCFNDGILNIYSTSSNGDVITKPIKYKSIPFENRTIGFQRNFIASQAHVDISDLIRVPKINIDKFDVIKKNGRRFEINQKQEILDTNPRCIQLTLIDRGEWLDG